MHAYTPSSLFLAGWCFQSHGIIQSNRGRNAVQDPAEMRGPPASIRAHFARGYLDQSF